MALLEELQGKREELRKTRKAVLTELVRKYGGVRALAVAISRPPEQLYTILSDRRNVGDKLARSIEEKLGLENGALDVHPQGNLDNDSPETARIEEKKETVKISRVPLLSCVQAGQPTDFGDIEFDEYVEVIGDLPDGCYGLKVSGDSMLPLIDHGDVVIVDPNRWPRPGDCVVARSELENLSEATIKRYYPIGFDETGREIFEARPFNPEYPVMHSVHQKLFVVGTVCKLIKDM